MHPSCGVLSGSGERRGGGGGVGEGRGRGCKQRISGTPSSVMSLGWSLGGGGGNGCILFSSSEGHPHRERGGGVGEKKFGTQMKWGIDLLTDNVSLH